MRGSEAKVIIMFKMLVLQQLHVFPTLNLRNNVLIEFLSGNFLVFLSTYQTISQSIFLEKSLLITANKKKYGDSCKANFIALV